MLKIKTIIIQTVLFIAIFSYSSFSEEIPRLIPFQGHLTSPKAGNPQQYEPVANGQYSILFTLYTAPVGGESKVWGPERHEKVVVVNGLVNVMIGSVMALPKEPEFFARPLYVGITIDADGNPNTPDLELVPRQVLLPVMYAQVAGSAITAQTAQTAESAQTAKTLLGEVLSNILTAKDSVLGATGYDRDKDGKVDFANIADKAINADHATNADVTNRAISADALTSYTLLSTHNYLRIGDLQMCWGTQAFKYAESFGVGFSADFIESPIVIYNTEYSHTANGTVNCMVSNVGKTGCLFSSCVIGDKGLDDYFSVNWIAIGKWK